MHTKGLQRQVYGAIRTTDSASRTNTSTIAPDDVLYLDLPPGVYLVRAVCHYEAHANADFAVGFDIDVSYVGTWGHAGVNQQNTPYDGATNRSIAATTGDSKLVQVEGTLKIDTAGRLELCWSPYLNVADDCKLLAGSALYAMRVL